MGDEGRAGFPGATADASHAAGETIGNAAQDAAEVARFGVGIRPRRVRLRPVQPAQPARLTARELECLAWAAQGKSEWEMARILGISEHTAEKHLINARVKLGAVNRVHAVATALRRGVIP
jgi:LuxR family quorum sensing-dependent transcriptional regulator